MELVQFICIGQLIQDPVYSYKRIIKINSEIDNIKYNKKNAVGTGVSCGIDSFYTIQNHCNRKEQDYNITHLTFFNAGASGEYGGDKARELYKKRMKFAKDFAILEGAYRLQTLAAQDFPGVVRCKYLATMQNRPGQRLRRPC